jgi:hypothetical protein
MEIPISLSLERNTTDLNLRRICLHHEFGTLTPFSRQR